MQLILNNQLILSKTIKRPQIPHLYGPVCEKGKNASFKKNKSTTFSKFDLKSYVIKLF